MDYTLQQLRYLVAVADHGSVSAAARSLYVSQPGLSSAILHLEEVFGIQCFIRHHAKGVSLTPAGHLFVKEARDVLFRASNLQKRAKELNETISGRLDIGCCSTIGPLLLPKILAELHESYPAIEVHLQDGDADSLQAKVRSGGVELAVLYDFNLDLRFEKLSLLSLAPYVLLPQSHRLASKSSIDLEGLMHEPLITFDQPDHWAYVRALYPVNGMEPKVGRRVNNLELIRGLVANGKGYSILNTRSALDHAADGSPLRCISINGIVPHAPIVLASSGGNRITSRAAAFVETCRSILDSFDVMEGRWFAVKQEVPGEHFSPAPVMLEHGLSGLNS
jgi:DNA-binding transcriptional LysR family regulator